MPRRELFWIIAMAAASCYASHTLLAMQVSADMSGSGAFVLFQKAAIDSILIVLGISFLSGMHRVSITPEMLFGIAAGILWYLFWDTHSEYHYAGLFAAAVYAFYAPGGPGAFLLLLNVCVAPVVIAAAAGLTAYQVAEQHAHKRRHRRL